MAHLQDVHPGIEDGGEVVAGLELVELVAGEFGGVVLLLDGHGQLRRRREHRDPVTHLFSVTDVTECRPGSGKCSRD